MSFSSGLLLSEKDGAPISLSSPAISPSSNSNSNNNSNSSHMNNNSRSNSNSNSNSNTNNNNNNSNSNTNNNNSMLPSQSTSKTSGAIMAPKRNNAPVRKDAAIPQIDVKVSFTESNPLCPPVVRREDDKVFAAILAKVEWTHDEENDKPLHDAMYEKYCTNGALFHTMLPSIRSLFHDQRTIDASELARKSKRDSNKRSSDVLGKDKDAAKENKRLYNIKYAAQKRSEKKSQGSDNTMDKDDPIEDDADKSANPAAAAVVVPPFPVSPFALPSLSSIMMEVDKDMVKDSGETKTTATPLVPVAEAAPKKIQASAQAPAQELARTNGNPSARELENDKRLQSALDVIDKFIKDQESEKDRRQEREQRFQSEMNKVKEFIAYAENAVIKLAESSQKETSVLYGTVKALELRHAEERQAREDKLLHEAEERLKAEKARDGVTDLLMSQVLSFTKANAMLLKEMRSLNDRAEAVCTLQGIEFDEDGNIIPPDYDNEGKVVV